MKLITCEIASKECIAVLSEARVFPLTTIGILPDYDLPGHGFSMTDVIRMWDGDFAKRISDAIASADADAGILYLFQNVPNRVLRIGCIVIVEAARLEILFQFLEIHCFAAFHDDRLYRYLLN